MKVPGRKRSRLDAAVTFIIHLSSFIFLLLHFVPSLAQHTPLGYWRFSAGNATVDGSGNNHPITTGLAVLNNNLSSQNPIAGQFFRAPDLANTPGVTGVDAGSTMAEVGLELWLRVRQGHWTGSVHWSNKCQLVFSDNYLEWIVKTADPPLGKRVLNVPLTGIGPADPYDLLDGGWHHVAAFYSARTGEQRIYIDGTCPPGFFVHHPNGGPINTGGTLNFTYNGGVDRLVADIDEFAAYDTVLPPQLVWEHYQSGLAGQPISFSQQSPVATYPFPPPVQEGGVNLLEFAPGYPNVPLTPLALFNTYPHPRYSVNDSIRPLVPWTSDPNPFTLTGVPIAQTNFDARIMHERLAHEWNYYLFCGGSHGNYDFVRGPFLGNPDYFIQQIIDMLNDPDNAGLPRFMVSNWGFATQARVYQDPNKRKFPYINLPKPEPFSILPAVIDSFYIRDSTLSVLFPPLGPIAVGWGGQRKNYAMGRYPSDLRFDSLTVDGMMQQTMIDTFMLHVNVDYLDMLGENDEQVGILDPLMVFRDAEITRDYNANFPGQPHKAYQGFRGNQMRWAYQLPWLVYLQGINATAGRGAPETFWYDVAGEEDAWQRTRDILQYRDGRRRASLHFYPQQPRLWRHGARHLMGMDQTCKALTHQLRAGDSLFIPPISPGFNDGDPMNFTVADVEMIRPGQYLGLLKGLGAMGAESYATFMLQTGVVAPSEGNWRTWHLPMASYAQAVTSRFRDFLYHGEVLNGDTTWTYNGGTLPTYYTFGTGNNNDLITARKLHGSYTYLLSASAQRTSNMPSQAPKEKTVSFRFRDNQGVSLGFQRIAIRERLQGSTYVLDMNGPNAPVFYQLDRWHEWKEPGRWCRDFDFEAEVWDSAAGTASIRTERPVPATSGDFTEFTSYVRHTGPGGWTQYYFRPTGDDQDTLYLWLRARNNDAIPRNVQVKVDGGQSQLVNVPPATGFGWHGASALPVRVRFTGLDTTAHWVEVGPQSQLVDVDRVLLLRSDADLNTLSNSSGIIWQPLWSICLGDTAGFAAEFGCEGCVDVEWDFGDGTHTGGDTSETVPTSCVDSVRHLYQYPGDYVVTVTVSHTLLDVVTTDTAHVHVLAPVVDAGPDTTTCRGVPVTLQGAVAAGAASFYWENPAPATLSSTSALNPAALLDSSQYFYLTATDSGGCSMTDSVWVTAIGLDSVAWPDTVWVCAGTPDTLHVSGAFWVTWDPRPGLSQYNIANPLAMPAQTTTYPFTATDVGRCDTVRDSVVVVVRGIVQQDTTVCLGTTLTLNTTGPGGWLWIPTGDSTASITVSPQTTTTYTVQLPGVPGGCNTDQVTVTVLPWRCCDVPGVPFLHNAQVSTTPFVNGGSYHVIGTLTVDQTVVLNNITFWMDSMAVIVVNPGETLETHNCTFRAACPFMWKGIELAGPMARWVGTGGMVREAEQGLSTTSGRFVLNNVTFRACWQGVFLNGGGGYLPRSILGCRFLPPPGGGLLPPYANHITGFSGVQLVNVQGFTLGSPTGAENRFEQLKHGLFSQNSVVNVYHNRFIGMREDSTVFPIGRGAGIYAVAPLGGVNNYTPSLTVGHPTSTALLTLTLHRNVFQNNVRGVMVERRVDVRARGNSFNANRRGYQERLCTGETVTLERNTHTNDSLAVHLWNGPGRRGAVDRNTITGSIGAQMHGIRLDMMVNPALPPAQIGIHIRNNTVTLRGNGIWVQGSDRVNVEANTVGLRAQVPQEPLRGITLQSNMTGACRVHSNTVSSATVLGRGDTAVQALRVFGSPESDVTCNTFENVGRGAVFVISSFPSRYMGNTMRNCVDGFVLMSGGRIGPQGTSIPAVPSENRWMGNFGNSETHSISSPGNLSRLFVRTLVPHVPNLWDTSGTNPTRVEWTVIGNPNPGQVFCNSGGTGGGGGNGGPITNIINNRVGGTAIKDATQFRADEWAEAVLLTDSVLLQTSNVFQSYHGAMQAINQGKVAKANDMLVHGDTLGANPQPIVPGPTEQSAINHKLVLEIRTDGDSLDAGEIATLRAIASQCEMLGGRAVSIARSLLAGVDEMIWDDPECNAAAKAGAIAGEPTPTRIAHCWPNPANDRIFFEFLPGNVSGLVQVIDARGVAVEEMVFLDQEGILELPLRGHSQGIYLVRAQLKDGTTFSWKVVLQR